MFTVDEFLNMLKYLYDLKVLQDQGSTALPSSDLDTSLLITLLSDQSKAKDFFEGTIDQVSFSTDDYKRLKSFLIDWYASLRAIATTQKEASSIYSMPEEHLNELIKCFGFEVKSLLRMSKQTKINLFFDLVNLYKIKGTPESIGRILQYYNIPNLEILEYWIQYDDSNNLVFRPSVIYSSNTDTSFSLVGDIDFDIMKALDPHWFLTKDQINAKFLTNKLGFPSKTPYIGIRPIISQSGAEQAITSSILSRKIHDEYDEWVSTSAIAALDEITLTYFNIKVSLLEAYLSYIYLFNRYYNVTTGGSGSSYLCYDGTSMTDISSVITLAESIIVKPTDLVDKKLKYTEYLEYFTRLMSGNFLSSADAAGIKLALINNTLKTLVDEQYSFNNSEDVLITTLIDISYWVSDNIGAEYPNLANLVYGFSTLNYIEDKINFFKPYRARLISVDSIYVFDNPLEDSVLTSDDTLSSIVEIAIDWDTADSEPGYLEDFDPSGNSVWSEPLAVGDQQISEIYVDSTGAVKAIYTSTPSEPSVRVKSTPGIGEYRVTNIYLEIDSFLTPILHVEYSDIPESVGGISSYILSDPPVNNYYIENVYYNSFDQFTIVYDSSPVIWPMDSTARIYYSRNLYDCGSYFDIGAVTDDPPEEVLIKIDEVRYDIYNYHTDDSTGTVTVQYFPVDAISEEYITDIITDGGWDEMDTDLVFDNPILNDVCHIYVLEVSP